MDTLPPSCVGALGAPPDFSIPRLPDPQPDNDAFAMPPILWGRDKLAAAVGPPVQWLWRGPCPVFLPVRVVQ